MATQLLETRDRNEAHRFLAEYLAQHPSSAAECREDMGLGLFWVYDGPERSPVDVSEEPRVTVVITGEQDVAASQEWLATRKKEG